MNLPYFDLAYAIEHFQMNKSEIGYFISEYSESIQDIDLDTINKYRKLSKYVTLIWLLILDKYYGNSGLNMRIVQLSLVEINKHAFVRNNPNYLFSGKKLTIPSINQIMNLVKNRPNKNRNVNNNKRNHIYFYGN